MVVVGSIWLLTVTEEHRQTVYGAVCFVGSGTSIMLVTALTMTGDLIGDDKVIQQQDDSIVYTRL